MSLDAVATHAAAKKKLRELAWLIREGKGDVLERGVLLPGRVGVGKSFLVDCFASECGLPMMEIAEFRSKWVGDTEIQQARILMTIRALGPVIVVVDEADAVFGGRESGGDDSGVSGRVFAAFAAHIGDQSLRGRELWIAMTSRPDLLAIDMKRQGRFGLSIPLFAAQNANEVLELFETMARVKAITLTDPGKTIHSGSIGSPALDRQRCGSNPGSIERKGGFGKTRSGCAVGRYSGCRNLVCGCAGSRFVGLAGIGGCALVFGPTIPAGAFCRWRTERP